VAISKKDTEAPVTAPDEAEARVYRSALRQDGTRWLLTAEEGSQVKPKSPGLVPALENAIAVIDYINHTPPHIASLAELSAALNISKSHCHSILKTLTHFGWLKFDNRSKSYELNSGLVASASSLLGSPVLDRIRAELSAFVRRAGLTTVLTQPQIDDTFIVVEKLNAPQAMEVSFPIGHHFPRDSTGHLRAYLAWQSPEKIDRWMQEWRPIRYTSATLLTEAEVRAEIAATRKRGYARSVGELTEGLMALAMPIFDRFGEVIYIFSCSGLLANVAPREEAIGQEMIQTAIDINQAIQGRAPPGFPP
jgi:DNA-binding IclR family transcriptional regulator